MGRTDKEIPRRADASPEIAPSTEAIAQTEGQEPRLVKELTESDVSKLAESLACTVKSAGTELLLRKNSLLHYLSHRHVSTKPRSKLDKSVSSHN
jgi:hypothetical protein